MTQLLVGIWPSYLSPCSAGSLTTQTLKSLDNTAELCQPRAGIGRQRLSLQSSRQWARTARLLPVRDRVTDRATTTTVRALWRLSGLWETSPGPRTTPMGEDADAAGSERRGSSVQWGRHMTCPSTPLLSHRSSRRANLPTQTRKHSALLAVLRLLLRSGDCFSSLCSSPSVLTPFGSLP